MEHFRICENAKSNLRKRKMEIAESQNGNCENAESNVQNRKMENDETQNHYINNTGIKNTESKNTSVCVSEEPHTQKLNFQKEVKEEQPQPKQLSPLETDFLKFQEKMKVSAPRVLQMREPITLPQYEELRAKITSKEDGIILWRTFAEMNNKPELLTKYSSAYFTFWHFFDMSFAKKKPVTNGQKFGFKSSDASSGMTIGKTDYKSLLP